ncbi:ADP-ribosylglycohydrolase family protein [Kaistella sp.]|uniref:ADP-ribosylglycohydrolase family protein n=1 Tax=Kaistella sp. TaxID=2782235 RepID=UPI0035A16B60
MILNTNILLGAVAGDIIGSTYEFNNVKTKDFNLYLENSKFTDDTVLTIAVADELLKNKDFSENLWNFA